MPWFEPLVEKLLIQDQTRRVIEAERNRLLTGILLET
jgi:hypothetical protein